MNWLRDKIEGIVLMGAALLVGSIGIRTLELFELPKELVAVFVGIEVFFLILWGIVRMIPPNGQVTTIDLGILPRKVEEIEQHMSSLRNNANSMEVEVTRLANWLQKNPLTKNQLDSLINVLDDTIQKLRKI